MDAIVASAISDQRVQAWLLGGFATVALVLSARGIYGVLSHAVSERSDEIGIRMALGARTTDVLRLVAGRGMLLASAGMVIGLAVSSMVVGTVEGMLHAVEPFDAWILVLAVALLAGVALTACVLPGLRAARIDPVAAIRD
jgi:ABC-type antimicrobial peptide transport system permease subunit